MYRIFRHLLYLALAAMLQTTWVHHIEIFEIQPDLILLVLVLIGAAAGHIEATIFGFGVGLFQDAYAPGDLGLNAFTKSIIGFAIGLGRSSVMIDTLHVRLLLVCVAVLFHDLIYYIGHSDIALADVPYYWLRYGIGRTLYSGVIAAVFISLFEVRRRYVGDEG
jgi:rod shape-determining protein MreD